MIIDSRIASETGEYDILIVGAGPAGIAMANELDGTGLRVALLESGGEEFDGDTQELYDGDVTGLEEEFDLTASRLRFLGGTSNHWGGRCVPFDPIELADADVVVVLVDHVEFDPATIGEHAALVFDTKNLMRDREFAGEIL